MVRGGRGTVSQKTSPKLQQPIIRRESHKYGGAKGLCPTSGTPALGTCPRETSPQMSGFQDE